MADPLADMGPYAQAIPPPDAAPPTTGGAIDAAAAKYGLSPAVLKGIASIESSFNPGSNRNKSTQYKGLFQIGRDEWKQYGGGGDIYNAADNANAAARMLADHAQWFNGQYGREPTPGELYMMHLQGRGFISHGTMTNVAGNPYPGMRGPQTPESFAQGWGNTLARRMAPFGGADSIYATGGAGGPVPAPPGAVAVAAPAPAPQQSFLSKMFGGIPAAPGAALAPPVQGPMPSGNTVQGEQQQIDAAQKVLADQKQAETDKTSKGMMALAQQLMAAGQAPKAQFMQLQPGNTAPLHPLPLNIPQFAEGGIVNRPTLGIVGENGPEAIVPLTGYARAIQGLAPSQNIEDRRGQTSGGDPLDALRYQLALKEIADQRTSATSSLARALGINQIGSLFHRGF